MPSRERVEFVGVLEFGNLDCDSIRDFRVASRRKEVFNLNGNGSQTIVWKDKSRTELNKRFGRDPEVGLHIGRTDGRTDGIPRWVRTLDGRTGAWTGPGSGFAHWTDGIPKWFCPLDGRTDGRTDGAPKWVCALDGRTGLRS